MRLLPLTLLLALDLVAASTHKPAEADVDQELAEGDCVDVGVEVIERAAPDHVRMIRRIVFDELDSIPGLDRDAALTAMRAISAAAEDFRGETIA